MSHGLARYLYPVDGRGHCVIPDESGRVCPSLELLRGVYHTIRVQGLRTPGASLASDLTVAAGDRPDWPNFTGATVGLKTWDNYINGGDFTAAWSGFDTGDTAWHSPAAQRYSIAVAPTSAITAGVYYFVGNLYIGSVAYPFIDFPLTVPLVQSGIIGTEPTAPTGISSNSGSATILNGTDSIAVAFTGMTTGGYVIPFWLGAAQSTLSAIAGTDTFTIQAGGPVVGNSGVGYFVVKTS